MARAVTETRREELLAGVMRIIAARGFADVRLSDVASELHCSLTSLYKIAPNKDSLLALAITNWGEHALAEAQASALQGATAYERARRFYHAVAMSTTGMSRAFRRDMERFESTRLAYRAISDRSVELFVGLVERGGARRRDPFREPSLPCGDAHLCRGVPA